jgi:hypothetical protein
VFGNSRLNNGIDACTSTADIAAGMRHRTASEDRPARQQRRIALGFYQSRPAAS